jgi:predicted transcriptional regulator YdeE
MNNIELAEIKLTGLALKMKTSNENGQSGFDCGALWQKFENEGYFDKIPGKLSNEILAVYHQYDGDYTRAFSYFIGCKVNNDAIIPKGLDSLIIPKGNYLKITSKGKIPECLAHSWIEIWNSDIPRAYKTDFEVYDERTRDWGNAEIDIFLSV